MNARQPIDRFVERIQRCPECGGSGMRSGHAISPYALDEFECFDCGGAGEWTAECAECREEKPLDGDGVCRDCAFALTATIGDPLLNRSAE